jgi:hypothetical protein
MAMKNVSGSGKGSPGIAGGTYTRPVAKAVAKVTAKAKAKSAAKAAKGLKKSNEKITTEVIQKRSVRVVPPKNK